MTFGYLLNGSPFIFYVEAAASLPVSHPESNQNCFTDCRRSRSLSHIYFCRGQCYTKQILPLKTAILSS